MRLRPHHLFCIQGFQGIGYSEEFTAYFSALAARVREDTATPITVVEGPDDVCSRCPHLHGEMCTWEEVSDAGVREHDNVIFQALGLGSGSRTTIADVRAHFFSDADAAAAIKAQCATCPWTGICTFWAEIQVTVPRTQPS